jgi:hypothetical protein
MVSDENTEEWAAASHDLLLAAVEGRIEVFGVKVSPGIRSTADLDFTARTKIDSFEFADCVPVANPHEPQDFDVEAGKADLLLRVAPYEADGGWQEDGMSDELVDRNGYVRWTKLTLQRADVVRVWKFDRGEQYRTGERGQPTLTPHIMAELEALHLRGELPGGIV